MKYIFLVIFGMTGFSASAQWYHIDWNKVNFLKKRERYPIIHPSLTTQHAIAQLPVIPVNAPPAIQHGHLNRSKYSYNAEEAYIIHTAQHNMGVESYTDASHNFSSLGRMYIRQKRYSEAKWYLLQSNNISRRQNDDKLTVSNLIDLAVAKTHIGDYKLAEKDLDEARQLAVLKGYTDDVAEIDRRLQYIKQNNFPSPKTDVRYAEVP